MAVTINTWHCTNSLARSLSFFIISFNSGLQSICSGLCLVYNFSQFGIKNVNVRMFQDKYGYWAGYWVVQQLSVIFMYFFCILYPSGFLHQLDFVGARVTINDKIGSFDFMPWQVIKHCRAHYNSTYVMFGQKQSIKLVCCIFL